MLASNDIPQIAFIVLLLGKNFYTCHEQVIISKELLKDKSTEWVTEALVTLWI